MTGKPHIGVIGSGFIGGELGQLLSEAGYPVTFGSRTPDSTSLHELLDRTPLATAATLQATVDAADVLLVALPAHAISSTLRQLGGLNGKVIIDATNRVPPDGRSSSHDILATHPGAHVVKAFNTIGGENYAHPERGSVRATMPYAGDHQAAKDTAARIIGDLGFEPLDAGPLANAILLEQLAVTWVGLSRTLGRDFVWKILQ